MGLSGPETYVQISCDRITVATGNQAAEVFRQKDTFLQVAVSGTGWLVRLAFSRRCAVASLSCPWWKRTQATHTVGFSETPVPTLVLTFPFELMPARTGAGESPLTSILLPCGGPASGGGGGWGPDREAGVHTQSCGCQGSDSKLGAPSLASVSGDRSIFLHPLRVVCFLP